MVQVFYADVSPLSSDGLFDSYFSKVSPHRQEKINARRLRRDKNLALGSAILLDRVLREYGTEEKNVKYGYGPAGKPFFPYIPSLHFSISHSGNFAVVAFSGDPVGCDIEKTGTANFKIAERYFCREEFEEITASADPDTDFFRFWTLKESFMKATGSGFKIPLDSFCITLNGGSPHIVRSDSKADYTLFEFSCLPGYCMACCYGKGCPLPTIAEIAL